LTLDKVH